MLKTSKLATFALLWLVFAGLALAAPVSVTFQEVGHDYPISQAGRFQGTINSGPVFNMFCVDFQNSIDGTPYTAWISDSTDLSKTRFGTTTTFTYNPPSITLTALDRYTMAAWLTQQFAYVYASGSPAPTAADIGMQDAIWTLLAQNPAAPAGAGNAITTTWINNALAFRSGNPSGFATLQSNLRIITSADVAGASDRYHAGKQEFIYVTNPVPEPATYLMLGGGLIALGFSRRRRAQELRTANRFPSESVR